MVRLTIIAAFLSAHLSLATAQCGSGSPAAEVTGSTGAYVATYAGAATYSGASYLAAIQAAVKVAKAGDRIAVIASGSIGAASIDLSAGQIFEGCGAIDAQTNGVRGAIQIRDVDDVHVCMERNKVIRLNHQV